MLVVLAVWFFFPGVAQCFMCLNGCKLSKWLTAGSRVEFRERENTVMWKRSILALLPLPPLAQTALPLRFCFRFPLPLPEAAGNSVN